MKKNMRGMTMGLLIASTLLSGCFSAMGLRDGSEVTLRNNARIMTLQRGMTPEQVIEHIGPIAGQGLSPVFPTVI